MLGVKFFHCVFLVNKNKNISFNKIQVCFLYFILVKKAKFVFLLVLQRFSRTLIKAIKSELSFDFRFKIPSKAVLNVILLEILNVVKNISVVSSFKFYNFSKRQTRFSLVRSPFVFKKSQEQLQVDLYTSRFLVYIHKNCFLISAFIENFIFNNLKKLCLLDILVIKCLTTN